MRLRIATNQILAFISIRHLPLFDVMSYPKVTIKSTQLYNIYAFHTFLLLVYIFFRLSHTRVYGDDFQN
jgi:hypothetical protein